METALHINGAYDIGCPINWFAGVGLPNIDLDSIIGGFQYKEDEEKIRREEAKKEKKKNQQKKSLVD